MRHEAEPFVYFIKPVGMPGPIKIGHSRAPASRLDMLAAWSPWPLEIAVTVPGPRDLEQRIHEHFAQHHSHKEWFHGHPDILSAIERIKSGVPVEEAIDLSVKTGSILSAAQKNRFPTERRRYISYSHRIRWASKKVDDRERRHEPLDVALIMERWGGYRCPMVEPTDAEIARLEEVLADPASHFVTDKERWPSLAKQARAA